MFKLPQSVICILIASAGGLTNFLMDEEHSIYRLVVSMVTAGFTGFLVFLFCKEMGYSDNIISVLCGISGLSGEAFLKVIKKKSTKFLSVKLDSKINEIKK